MVTVTWLPFTWSVCMLEQMKLCTSNFAHKLTISCCCWNGWRHFIFDMDEQFPIKALWLEYVAPSTWSVFTFWSRWWYTVQILHMNWLFPVLASRSKIMLLQGGLRYVITLWISGPLCILETCKDVKISYLEVDRLWQVLGIMSVSQTHAHNIWCWSTKFSTITSLLCVIF